MYNLYIYYQYYIFITNIYITNNRFRKIHFQKIKYIHLTYQMCLTITIIFEHALNESDFIMDIVRLEFKRREAINISYKY